MIAAEPADAVAAALADDEFLAKLQDLLCQADAAAERQGFDCRACGKCCRFEQFGHKLYVSTGELAMMVRGLDGPGRRTGKQAQTGPAVAGLCPHQQGETCAARQGRALGCRLFFCDPAAEDWFCQTYEDFHRRIKLLHELHGIGYFYAELTSFLVDSGWGGF